MDTSRKPQATPAPGPRDADTLPPATREADQARSGKLGAQAPDYGAPRPKRFDARRPHPDGPRYEEGGAYPGVRPDGNEPAAGPPRGDAEGLGAQVRQALVHSGYPVDSVSVQARQGWIRLDGDVPDAATRQAIHGCVEQCPGVHGVENHLSVTS
ncbi:BON domain-containing protein [Bordetella trematum]|uniref:BON domain-containing protein n=1 Tax=Bordetella trematum TaxID=123899 RepID=UPI003AF359DB